MNIFNSQFIEELKTKNDIVSVISRYMQLEKKGRNFWGRCPFHHEKTASFAVNAEQQFYHCFGCGASGDVIKFIKELESLEFMDAVKLLCNQCGMEEPSSEYLNDENLVKKKKQKERAYLLMKDLANFYYKSLYENESAIGYFLERGVSKESIKSFALGFSPNYNASIEYLLEKGYREEEMAYVGVVQEKNGRRFDALFKRLIFPIIDNYGQVIAFGGRITEKADFAKYKNTQETPIFTKSKALYGIHLLKKLKQEKPLESLIVVEGYMDTIALWQNGFCNVVASMGTALTKEQARILKRYVDKVYICFDGDSAGQKATIRGLEILQAEGLTVLVVELPDGLDPDELILQRGKIAYQQALENALPLVDFKLKVLKNHYNLENADQKRKFIQSALKVVAQISNNTEKEDCLKILRADTGYSLDILKKDLENLDKTEQIVIKDENKTISKKDSPTLMALRFILYYNLTKGIDIDGIFEIEKFLKDEVHIKIYKFILEHLAQSKKILPSMLFEVVEENEFAEIIKILSSADDKKESEIESFYKDCLNLLENLEIENMITDLTQQFEKQSDLNVRKEIAQKISVLMRRKNDRRSV